MANYQLDAFFGHIRKAAGVGARSEATDRQLLMEFATTQIEESLTALMLRHGPMILGVCRRFLREPADVEDAFQATFLVLVKNARSRCWRDSLAGWLHEVALRIARKASTRNKPTSCGVPERMDSRASDPCAEASRRELRTLIDAVRYK